MKGIQALQGMIYTGADWTQRYGANNCMFLHHEAAVYVTTFFCPFTALEG